MEIRKLLEKYYEGRTSLEEEEFLAEYFRGGTIPDDLRAEREVFQAFFMSRSVEVLGEDFDREMMDLILRETGKKPPRQLFLYRIFAVAAGLALLAGAYFFLTNERRSLQELPGSGLIAVQDPEIALEETRKALYLISEVFNRGTSELVGISKFSQGTSQLQGLGKIHEVEQLITSNK